MLKLNINGKDCQIKISAMDTLKEAIISMMKQDATIATLLESSDINISGDDKRLILNDKCGFGISIDGTIATLHQKKYP